MITVGLAVVLGLSLLWTGPAPAQQGHQHERMPNVMEYLDRLDRPERDQDQKPAQAPATSRGVLWKGSLRPAKST